MSDSGESSSSSSSPPDNENDSNSPPSPDSSFGSSSPPKGGGSSDSKSLPPSGSSFKSSPPSPDSLPSNSSSSNSTPPPSSPPPSKESPPPKSDSPPPSPPPSSSDTKNSTTSSSSPPPPPKSSETNPPSSEIEAPPTSKTPPSSSPPPSGNSISTPPVTGGSKQTPIPPVSKSPPATPLSPPRTPSGSGSGSDQVNKSPDDLSPPNDANYTPSLRPPSNSNSKSADSSSNSNSPSSSSSSSSSSDSSSSSSNGNTGTVIGVAIAGVFVIAFIAIFFVIKRRKKRPDTYNNNNYMPPEGYYSTGHSGNSGGPHSTISSGIGSLRGGMYHTGGGSESGVIGGPNPHFSYEELMEITNGFSRQNILGEGGFGCVFKGWLLDGKEVAVKQLKAGSGQGEREFRAEVDIISRVHHRHLVSLVGYCLAENHRLLIYEFVPNKTLEYHLHDNEASVLDWPNRLKIALGAAKGLAYLHEDCHPKIIHRDIKTANILLDEFYEAKVADFGLAKLANDTNTHVSTRVMGTFGYMAPEYASSGKLTDRSDVYSFGVVLLELVTGRKPVDPTQPLGDESLVEWARPLLMRALQTGDLSEIIDPRLEKHYVESEMFRMIEAAAACIRHSAPKRPRMMQVVRALDCEGEHSDLSNGLKYGQSTIYDSGQYNQDISKFRKMALGSEDSSEYEIYSGDYNSKEYSGPHKNPLNNTWSGESETRAFKQG